MKQAIATDNAPKAIGPYSQAIKTGNIVFISGQLGINPTTNQFDAPDTAGQTRQMFKNAEAILSEAGFTFDHVVKTTLFLADMADFSVVNDIYAEYFNQPYPARSTVAVKTLPKNGLVEMEIIAIAQ
jgi:2-iminobutanoate/2-iminopropanoate deaminase